MDNLTLFLVRASLPPRLIGTLAAELDFMDSVGSAVKEALHTQMEIHRYAAWSAARNLLSAERMRLMSQMKTGTRGRRKEEKLETLTEQYLSDVAAAVNQASEQILQRSWGFVDRDGGTRMPPQLMLDNEKG